MGRKGREKGEIRGDEGGCEAGGCLRCKMLFIYLFVYLSSRKKARGGKHGLGRKKWVGKGEGVRMEAGWVWDVIYLFLYLFIYSCSLSCG